MDIKTWQQHFTEQNLVNRGDKVDTPLTEVECRDVEIAELRAAYRLLEHRISHMLKSHNQTISEMNDDYKYSVTILEDLMKAQREYDVACFQVVPESPFNNTPDKRRTSINLSIKTINANALIKEFKGKKDLRDI